VDARSLGEFLSWTASWSSVAKAGNGARIVREAKPKTAYPYYRALRRLFDWAVGEGYLESSPLATIHFRTPPAPPVEPYTLEELKELVAVCDLDARTGARFTGLRNKAMLLLFLELGPSQEGDSRPETQRRGSRRQAHTTERKPRAEVDRLWVTEEGSAFSSHGLASGFNRLKQRADQIIRKAARSAILQRNVHARLFRHAYAINFLNCGGCLDALQKQLGHRDINTTRIYPRLSDEDMKREVVKVLL